MCLSELMSSDPNKLHHTLYLPLKPAHTPLTLCCHMKKELQKGNPALDCKVFFWGGHIFLLHGYRAVCSLLPRFHSYWCGM